MQQDSQPASDYDFIMKPEQKQAKKSGFSMPNLPKPALIILGAAILLIVLILFYALLFGNKTSGSDEIAGVIGRANEISRISDLVAQSAQDTQTKNLAATTEAAMASDSARLSSYLAGRKVKVDAAKLKTYVNKNTDTQLQTAQQNNGLPAFYTSYLKTNLSAYANAVATAFKDSGPIGKGILNDAFNNAAVLLKSPQVAGASSS